MAFGIEAAWAEKVERNEEAEYLAALLRDVDSVIAEAGRTIAETERLNEESAARVAALEGLAEVPDSMYDESVRWMSTTYRMRTNLDAYSDLVSSGGVTKLSDAGVREALSRLRSGLDFEYEMTSLVVIQVGELRAPIFEAYARREPSLSRLLIEAERVGLTLRNLHIARKRDVETAADVARSMIMRAIESK